jgi:dihydroneopterin aldolase
MAAKNSASPAPMGIADGAHKIRHVFIRDMVVDCSIGIYTHEKEHEQRVRINLDLSVGEGDSLINDDIRNVISYEDMAKGIEAIIAEGHINLVETLAEKFLTCACRMRGCWWRGFVWKSWILSPVQQA